MPFKPGDFPKFEPLDKETLRLAFAKFFTYLGNISGVLGIDLSRLKYNREALYEMIERVEKRRAYFHIYHNIEMGELNEGALMCFWVLKLHPFVIKDDLTPYIPSYELNARIALCLFLNMVRFYAQNKGKQVLFTYHMAEHIKYSFMFRDISKEAIMILAEGLIR
ncbi:hypothetical protein AGMMS4952_01950 [Spirochaetia bacterium]|nr:hypothetical protein AGMMS4952_01950 [Spirochaetia bacterium]